MNDLTAPSIGGAQIPSVKRSELQPLTVEECKELMQWQHKSDKEISEFLTDLRSFLHGFLETEYPIDPHS